MWLGRGLKLASLALEADAHTTRPKRSGLEEGTVRGVSERENPADIGEGCGEGGGSVQWRWRCQGRDGGRGVSRSQDGDGKRQETRTM